MRSGGADDVIEIRTDNLTKRFGDVTAVDGLSITVPRGELFFLLGPSGCGKTTLLRLIAGFLEPDAGTIHFDDRRMDTVGRVSHGLSRQQR